MSKLTATTMSTLDAACFVLGELSHLLFFKQGERHLQPLRYVLFYLFAYLATISALANYTAMGWHDAVRSTTIYTAIYFCGLFSSLLVYRAFFNPLNRFPGPAAARMTKFSATFMNAPKLNSYKNLLELHRRHGHFVRIGPNDMSVTHPDAVMATMGSGTKCYKGPSYDIDDPNPSLLMQRPKAVHDRRRRTWAPAFSDRALRGYECRIRRINEEFLTQMHELATRKASIDASRWFSLYAFDVMGDLAFGKSYGMVTSGTQHWTLKILSETMVIFGLTLPEWTPRLLISFRWFFAQSFMRFRDFCNAQLDERMRLSKEHVDHPDIMATLLDHYHKTNGAINELTNLQTDCRLIVIAGSDTTSATFTNLFYYLARDPDLQQRIRNEISALASGSDSTRTPHARIQEAPLLNGAINEALRLHPPVPSGVIRTTPPEGLTIGGTFIPGNTKVQCPTYVLARSEANWEDCESFVPERWSSRPEMIKRKDTFASFTHGADVCIGKNLAYMELRLLTADLLDEFDIKLAPGEDGSRLFNESQERFTLAPGPLNLEFIPRGKM